MNGICLFVSRHTPTEDQFKVAKLLGYTLVPAGDCNAFDQDEVSLFIEEHLTGTTTAVACVHPLMVVEALRLELNVVIFENANRAAVGEKPNFHCCGVTVICGEELEHYQYDGKDLIRK